MSRLGFASAFLALFLIVIVAGKSESNSTITAPFPDQPNSELTPDNSGNKTKDGTGPGRYNSDRHHSDRGYGRKNHREGHRKRHDDDYDAFPYSKPYFDTHYCSVHGSFRLAYNEKAEKKEYEGGNKGYQQESGYGNNAGSYGSQGGSYGNNAGSYGKKDEGYGKKDEGYGKKDEGYGKKEKTHYVRKITRQYCRYAAAWSEKACKFCCKVVARSAYTNPDDIIAAIFSFDPANPSNNGYGVESYGKHNDHSDEYEHDKSYEHQRGGHENQGGYDNQKGYGNQQSNYNQGAGQSYNQQPYSSPPAYGNGPYRAKRNSGYSQSPAPSYGSSAPAQSYDQYAQQPASDNYQQPAGEYQAPASDQYSATPDAYSTKPDQGNKYENSANAINQCVCCAPKHRYY